MSTCRKQVARGFGVTEGIAVDTHVKKVSRKLGLTKHFDPEKIEQDLMTLVPKEDFNSFSMTLIYHGREICQTRKPKCPSCVVNKLCPSSVIFMSQYYL